MDHEGKKAMVKKIWKMSVLNPKTSKEFYHQIKSNLKNFSIFTAQQLYWSLFFNKNAGLQVFRFIKKRLQQMCFRDNIAKFLRAAILKNICERLLVRVFPFMLVWTFSKWKNNIKSCIGKKEDVFPRKQNKKNILKVS